MESAHCKKCVVASQSLNSERRRAFQQNLMLSAMPELRVSAYRSPFFNANGCPGENSHSLAAMLEFLDILFFPASTQLSILHKFYSLQKSIKVLGPKHDWFRRYCNFNLVNTVLLCLCISCFSYGKFYKVTVKISFKLIIFRLSVS